MTLSLRIYCGCLLACSAAAHAETLTVDFDHASESNLTRTLEPKPGDEITATVTNTCPGHFLYASTVLKKTQKPEPPSPPGGPHMAMRPIPATCGVPGAKNSLLKGGYCQFESQKVEFIHTGDNAGYIIELRKKEEAPAKVLGLTKEDYEAAIDEISQAATCDVPAGVAKKAKKLDETKYLISARASPWAIGMSGGVSISNVVDPRFAIINDPASTATPPGTIVIHDKRADDNQAVGFAGYLHVHHERFKIGSVPLAVTLGLGIDDQSAINTMVGLSAAAGDLAYITFGWNWRSVDRLPAGQELGMAPISDNVLGGLPKRTDSGWFLGVSFKFMSPGEGFFKGKVVPKVEKEEEEEGAAQ